MPVPAPLNPEWLSWPIPDDPAFRKQWNLIIDFFLIHSPCRYQSNRRNDLTVNWGNQLWKVPRYLKRRLNQAVFGRDECRFYASKSKDAMENSVDEYSLDEHFYQNLERQLAVCVKQTSNGNSSVYMSFFYHLRNALAHARFGIGHDKQGRYVFVFEDISSCNKPENRIVSARGIVRIDSLIHIIEILNNGPDALPNIEQLILGLIEEGINTKKKICDELNLTESDWRTYINVLKVEGKVRPDKKKWKLAVE